MQTLEQYSATEHLREVACPLVGSRAYAERWPLARCADRKTGRCNALLPMVRAHIGSGAVEAASKRSAGERLRQPGIRWTQSGINAILGLCACILSGRYEQ